MISMASSDKNEFLIESRTGYAGLYIHFPFCIQKCSYCDFFSIGSGKKQDPLEIEIFQSYKLELEGRIHEHPSWLDYNFDTIFFGGGTPSRMDLPSLQNFLTYIRSRLSVSPNAEFCLEANPEDITKDNLLAWRELGFTRINMGYQTSHPKYLEYVGRFNEASIYKEAPKLLAESGFPTYGYDLIYGFPNQSLEEFRVDLDLLLEMDPKHLSLYSLTVEKGTQYSREIQEGKKLFPEEELQKEILEFLPTWMKSKGWDWYEVSNYCKPGNHSRHNLKYWTLEPYLSLGPSAHGFTGLQRYANPRNLAAYMKKPTQSKWSSFSLREEFALSIFRIFYPISMGSFFQQFPGLDIDHSERIFAKWVKKGLADYDNQTKIFQWKPKSVLQLDEYIFEFCE